MATVLDIEAGGTLRITAADVRTTRIARVKDLTGSDADAMLYDAYVALGALGAPQGGPIQVNTPHPSIPNVVALVFDIEPIAACGEALVEIQYGIPAYSLPPTPGSDGADHKTIRYFGQPRQYTRDPKDGVTELTVDPPAKFAGRTVQTKTVTVNRGQAVITFNRVESAAPTARARAFQNHVNVGALGGGVYAAKTLYCNVIQADTRDQGGLYVVRYEFVYDKDGHEIEYKWERSQLEVEVYDANSRKTLEPYETADFTLLGLDFND